MCQCWHTELANGIAGRSEGPSQLAAKSPQRLLLAQPAVCQSGPMCLETDSERERERERNSHTVAYFVGKETEDKVKRGR